jgi:N-acetylmuramoyl-L-alanine amidase
MRMPAEKTLIERLATVYAGEKIRHPRLRAVTFAQWLLESGRGTSDLAKLHYNFGGLKWRPEMAGYATEIQYDASDGVDQYCKFATLGGVDGFDQDEAGSECDEGCEVSSGLLAA